MPAQKRHRSSVACQECRARKVRCSVTVTGVPCSRCAQDKVDCVVQDGHYALPQGSLSSVDHGEAITGNGQVHLPTGHQSPSHPLPRSLGQPLTIDLQRASNNASPEALSTDGSLYPPGSDRQRDLNEEQSGVEISFAARGQGSTDCNTPFYTGEQPGVTTVVDLHSQKSAPRHLLLRPSPAKSIPQYEQDYLRSKGVLNLPKEPARRELLIAYFHNIHPILPIMDANILKNMQEPFDTSIPNLLLFWSMASVAINFVPSSVWQLEGFPSRKDMKDTTYRYAKALYDIGSEATKEHQLQCALLLCFWHSDRDSHSQPWYWSGVAVSLCQIIGIHRNPDSVTINPSISPRSRRMWRRIWGACFFRDRWLSLTLGRPMRIRLEDCDMPFPTVEDVLADIEEIESFLQETYIPKDFSRLVRYWISLLDVSRLLGDVLTLCYQQNGTTPSLQQCDSIEAELKQYSIPERSRNRSPLEAFFYYHAHLHHQAVLITFYRPLIAITPRGLEHVAVTSWRNDIRSRMEDVATSTNTVLDHMAREDLVRFAGPMTPPLLIPAMHVHLLNCKSTNSLVQRLGFNKLELCMTVMRELQKTYTSASMFCGIFGEVQRFLKKSSMDQHRSAMLEAENVNVGQPHSLGSGGSAEPVDIDPALMDDNLFNSLLDEQSGFNLWESMGMMELPFDTFFDPAQHTFGS